MVVLWHRFVACVAAVWQPQIYHTYHTTATKESPPAARIPNPHIFLSETYIL